MKLKCKFYDNPNGYTFEVLSATIIKPSTVIKKIQGDHEAGKSNKDVLWFWFQDVAVHFIPRGLSDFFPNITSITIINCGLESICRGDLKQYKNLEWLYIGHNPLTTLPDDLFQYTLKLNEIYINNNKIEFMSSKLFDPIINNEFISINFQGNTKIHAFFKPGHPYGVASVADLMKIIDSQCSKPEPIALQTSFDASQIHHQNFAKGFVDSFDSSKFSDFVITVDDSKQFHVHKVVLASQCEGFVEIFEKDPEANEMKIEDLSPEAVEKFLRYLYTGKLENFAEHSLEIFALSSKFKANDLIESIEEFIIDYMEHFDALKVFSMAHSFESHQLKREAFEEIEKNLGRKLSEDLVENLEKVKQIVDIWKKFDSLAKNEGN